MLQIIYTDCFYWINLKFAVSNNTSNLGNTQLVTAIRRLISQQNINCIFITAFIDLIMIGIALPKDNEPNEFFNNLKDYIAGYIQQKTKRNLTAYKSSTPLSFRRFVKDSDCILDEQNSGSSKDYHRKDILCDKQPVNDEQSLTINLNQNSILPNIKLEKGSIRRVTAQEIELLQALCNDASKRLSFP